MILRLITVMLRIVLRRSRLSVRFLIRLRLTWRLLIRGRDLSGWCGLVWFSGSLMPVGLRRFLWILTVWA